MRTGGLKLQDSWRGRGRYYSMETRITFLSTLSRWSGPRHGLTPFVSQSLPIECITELLSLTSKCRNKCKYDYAETYLRNRHKDCICLVSTNFLEHTNSLVIYIQRVTKLELIIQLREPIKSYYFRDPGPDVVLNSFWKAEVFDKPMYCWTSLV